MSITIKEMITDLVHDNRQIVDIHFAGQVKQKEAYQHVTVHSELLFVLEGEFTVTMNAATPNRKVKQVGCNDLLYIPGGMQIDIKTQQPARCLHLKFADYELKLLIEKWEHNRGTVVHSMQVNQQGPRICGFIFQALAEYSWLNEPVPYQNNTILYLIKGLLGHTLALMNLKTAEQSRSDGLYQMVRRYIDNHFHLPITRETIAKQFFLSPNYLSTLFHRHSPIGLNEYINQQRLEYAKKLLKGHELNIKAIAQNCGYQDSNYFCRIFRKYTCLSPSQYRASHANY